MWNPVQLLLPWLELSNRLRSDARSHHCCWSHRLQQGTRICITTKIPHWHTSDMAVGSCLYSSQLVYSVCDIERKSASHSTQISPHADNLTSGLCARQTALERKDLSCTYLAQHELESNIITITIVIIIIIIVIVIVIITVIYGYASGMHSLLMLHRVVSAESSHTVIRCSASWGSTRPSTDLTGHRVTPSSHGGGWGQGG